MATVFAFGFPPELADVSTDPPFGIPVEDIGAALAAEIGLRLGEGIDAIAVCVLSHLLADPAGWRAQRPGFLRSSGKCDENGCDGKQAHGSMPRVRVIGARSTHRSRKDVRDNQFFHHP